VLCKVAGGGAHILNARFVSGFLIFVLSIVKIRASQEEVGADFEQTLGREVAMSRAVLLANRTLPNYRTHGWRNVIVLLRKILLLYRVGQANFF